VLLLVHEPAFSVIIGAFADVGGDFPYGGYGTEMREPTAVDTKLPC
jgi:hypothetical protein